MSKKIYLIGAKGMLGQDIVLKAPFHHQVIPASSSVDIRKKDLVKTDIEKIKPDWVINTAAFNDVDKAEYIERAKAFEINAEGPRHIAEVCDSLSIPFIHFSTDYVFSSRIKPYGETDPVDPLGGYGQSKYAGEEFVRHFRRHYVIRLTTLYGAGRMNHALRALNALKGKGAAKAANDLICSPSFTGDLAVWVHTLIDRGPEFGTYHLAHKGLCSRFEFAKKLGDLLKAKKPYPIESIELAKLQLDAPRPLHVELKTEKWEKLVCPLFSWEKGLTNFLKEMKALKS